MCEWGREAHAQDRKPAEAAPDTDTGTVSGAPRDADPPSQRRPPLQQSHTMHASPAASAASTPLKRLALHSTSTCAAQASAYGKCIVATYTDVRKDSCKAEFDKFGACLRTAVRALSLPLSLDDRALTPHSIPSVQMKRKW